VRPDAPSSFALSKPLEGTANDHGLPAATKAFIDDCRCSRQPAKRIDRAQLPRARAARAGNRRFSAPQELAHCPTTSFVVPFSSFRTEFGAREAGKFQLRQAARCERTVNATEARVATACFARLRRGFSAAGDEIVAIATTTLRAISDDRNTSSLPARAHPLAISVCMDLDFSLSCRNQSSGTSEVKARKCSAKDVLTEGKYRGSLRIRQHAGSRGRT
jgi:hypothetical protein